LRGAFGPLADTDRRRKSEDGSTAEADLGLIAVGIEGTASRFAGIPERSGQGGGPDTLTVRNLVTFLWGGVRYEAGKVTEVWFKPPLEGIEELKELAADAELVGAGRGSLCRDAQ